MDKETLSNYGWIVICVLVLAVMIALATPFGSYVKNAVESTANGLIDTNNKGINTALTATGLLNNNGNNGGAGGATPSEPNTPPVVSKTIHAGTYTFKNTLSQPDADYNENISLDFNGKDAGDTIKSIQVNSTTLAYMTEDIMGFYIAYVFSNNQWSSSYPNIKTITIASDTVVSDGFYNWFTNNIDTEEPPASTVRNGIIPTGATYTPNGGTALTGNGTNTFPDTPQTGDTYEEGDYTYKYNGSYIRDGRFSNWVLNDTQNGWGVKVNNTSKTSYGEIISEIVGQPVNCMFYTFRGCTSLTTAPVIPNSVTNMSYTFFGCTSLTGTIEVNANPTSYSDCLYSTQITNITGSCSQATKDALMATK